MRLFMVVFYWPWLITLGGIAPLAARLVTVVMADAEDDEELEIPETAASVESLHKSVASAERTRAYLAAAGRQELDGQNEQVVVDWGRWPRADSESPLPKPFAGDRRIQGTIESYSRLRVAERFASRFLSGWKGGPYYRHEKLKKRKPWPVERAAWEIQVKEHETHGKGLRRQLDMLTDRIKKRVEVLSRLEDGLAELTTMRKRYGNMDWTGVEETGKPLKDELRSLLEDYSDDPDVEQDVPGWRDRVNSNLLSANFQDRFQSWKSNFDSVWPKLKGDVQAKRQEWQMVSKTPAFVLEPNSSGREQIERLDRQLKSVFSNMVDVEKEWQTVDQRVQTELATTTEVHGIITEEDVDTLQDDARGNLTRLEGHLVDVKETASRSERLGEEAKDRISSHEKVDAAWQKYRGAKRDRIDERIKQVGQLMDGFSEKTHPTGMIKQRLQCDMMDWLRGLFPDRVSDAPAGVREARWKGKGKKSNNGWGVGLFKEVPSKIKGIKNYDFYELEASGRIKGEKLGIVSVEIFSEEFPRAPLTSVLIDRFNKAIEDARMGFDEITRWKEFERTLTGLKDDLDAYIRIRGGKKTLRVNRQLTFSSELRDCRLLLEGTATLEKLFVR